jgi:hypothetical protein
MAYRRAKNLDKNLVFAEYFNSEQEVRRNGGELVDHTGVFSFDQGNALSLMVADSVIGYEGITVDVSVFTYGCSATFDASVVTSRMYIITIRWKLVCLQFILCMHTGEYINGVLFQRWTVRTGIIYYREFPEGIWSGLYIRFIR